MVCSSIPMAPPGEVGYKRMHISLFYLGRYTSILGVFPFPLLASRSHNVDTAIFGRIMRIKSNNEIYVTLGVTGTII